MIKVTNKQDSVRTYIVEIDDNGREALHQSVAYLRVRRTDSYKEYSNTDAIDSVIALLDKLRK